MLFGGIPVILLFGDDNQLPPVCVHGKGKGAFMHFLLIEHHCITL